MKRSKPKHSRGFSIVELMVALVISMVTMLVIYQVFAQFEARKRTTSGGTESQQNGLLGLYSIERDSRQAGYGINSAAYGCVANAWIGGANTALTMTPALIATDVNLNNTIDITHGTSGYSAGPIPLAVSAATQLVPFQVSYAATFATGNFVLVYAPGPPPACNLVQITSITPAGCALLVVNTCQINHDISSTYNPPGNTYPAGGYTNDSTTGGQLMNLGALSMVRYSVSAANQLIQTDLLNPAAPIILADNVVGLRAQYGFDANNDGVVSAAEYINPAAFPAAPTAANWQRVLSVRLSILARSSLRERPTVPGPCDASPALPLPGPAWAAFNMRNDADGTSWQCYRYSAYELIVPIRNSVWSF